MFNSFSYKNKYMFYIIVILIILFILFLLSFLKPQTLPSKKTSNPNVTSSIGASTATNSSLAPISDLPKPTPTSGSTQVPTPAPTPAPTTAPTSGTITVPTPTQAQIRAPTQVIIPVPTRAPAPAPTPYPSHRIALGPIKINGPDQMRIGDNVTFSITGNGIYVNTVVFWYAGNDIIKNKILGKPDNMGLTRAVLTLSDTDYATFPIGSLSIGAFIPSISTFIGKSISILPKNHSYPLPAITTPSLPPPAPPIQPINYITQPINKNLVTNIKAQWINGNNKLGGSLKLSFTMPTDMTIILKENYSHLNYIKRDLSMFFLYASSTPSYLDAIKIIHMSVVDAKNANFYNFMIPPGMSYIYIQSMYSHPVTDIGDRIYSTNFVSIAPMDDNLVTDSFTPSYITDTRIKSGIQVLKPRNIYFMMGYESFSLFWAQPNDINDPRRKIIKFAIKISSTQDNNSPSQTTKTVMDLTGDLNKYLAKPDEKLIYTNLNNSAFSFYKIDVILPKSSLISHPFVSIWALTQSEEWIYSDYVNSSNYFNTIYNVGPIQLFSDNIPNIPPPIKELNLLAEEARLAKANAAAAALAAEKAAEKAKADAKAKKDADDADFARKVEAASTLAERAECNKAREYCLTSSKDQISVQMCLNTYRWREWGRDPNNWNAVTYYKEKYDYGGRPTPCAAYGPDGCGDCSALHFYNHRDHIKKK
jgi:hypothetical protein